MHCSTISSFTGFVALWFQCQDLALPAACYLDPVRFHGSSVCVATSLLTHTGDLALCWVKTIPERSSWADGRETAPSCSPCLCELPCEPPHSHHPDWCSWVWELHVQPDLKLTRNIPQMWMLPPCWLTNHSEWITHTFITTLAGVLWILPWEKRSFWKIWSPVRRHGEGLKLPLPGWDWWMKKPPKIYKRTKN